MGGTEALGRRPDGSGGSRRGRRLCRGHSPALHAAKNSSLPRATSAGLPKGAGRVWCACAGIVESINKSQFHVWFPFSHYLRTARHTHTRSCQAQLAHSISDDRSRVGPARAYLSHGHRAIEYRISYRAERAPRRPAPWPKPSEQRAATGRPASPTPRSRLVSTHLRLVLDRCLWCPPA